MKYSVKQTEQNNAKEKQMRAKEFIKEADIPQNFDLTPEQRKAVAAGWTLKDKAAKVKDDRLAVAMSRVGDELTDWKKGAYGAKTLEELAKKSMVPLELVKKFIKFAQEQKSTMPDKSTVQPDKDDDSEFAAPSDRDVDRDAKDFARG